MTMQLPWWYPKLKAIESLPPISSGCSIVKGNVNCPADSMRRAAEQKFKKLQLGKQFGLSDSISMDEYSTARYGRTEVGSDLGSTVAVVEAGRNRAKMWGLSMDQLLRLRQPKGHPNRGYYGPIHATESECAALGKSKGCAPYGRWAGTKRDPRPVDILIAKLVLSGKTQNYAKGADDQLGPSAGDSLFGKDWIYKRIDSLASKGNYWVGLIPGVNHRKTMLFKKMPSVPASSSQGKQLIAQAKEWAHKESPDWTKVPIEAPPMLLLTPLQKWLATGIALAGAGGLAYALYLRRGQTAPIAAPPGVKYVLYASEECPACQEYKPALYSKVDQSMIQEVSLDTDAGIEKAQDAGIRVLPTLVRVSDGKKFPGGLDPKRLLAA